MFSTLDDRITRLGADVDDEIRAKLQVLIRTLRDSTNGSSTNDPVVKVVLVPMSSLALRLLRGVFAKAGHEAPNANLFDCIQRAASGSPETKTTGLHLVPQELASYLHTIRVLSNKADHACEKISLRVPDAENCLSLYLRALEWYYCEYEHGSRLETIYSTPDGPKARTAKVVLFYKRGAEPDEAVLTLLEGGLKKRGHEVFIDRHIHIGVDWARELEEQIASADAVVPIISASSIESEMLSCEVELAHLAAQKRGGLPRILPVRIQFDGGLPEGLNGILGRLQYFLWESPADDGNLVNDLCDTLERPKISQRPPKSGAGGGALTDSRFYITRSCDEEFEAAIERKESIVLIKGARQMGKTSLLARGLRAARGSSARVLFTDFQRLDSYQLSTPETFFIALGELIADQLDLSVYPTDKWSDRNGPNVNFERYLRREVLSTVDDHLIWGLDEVDRLFTTDFASAVFGLFRAWHNQRAFEPDGPWAKLTMAIAYATEAHLFITDMNQSPFNVGTPIHLEDFTLDEVSELNRRHGNPLRLADLQSFHRAVGGQPFLVQRGLYEMSARGWSFEDLRESASSQNGPFGDHLKRMLMLLAQDEGLSNVVCGVLARDSSMTPETFYRLRSAGILVGESGRDATLRCEIYGDFLRKHLL